MTERQNQHQSGGTRPSAKVRSAGLAFTALLCVAALLGVLRVPAESLTFPGTATEVRDGVRIAHQIETHYRIITTGSQEVARVNRIGSALGNVTERQDLNYRFRIVAGNDVASLSVPGGWVYVTEGMLRFVRTDDELAAVLGHELAHIDHHHYYIEQDEMKRLGIAVFLGATVLPRTRGPLSSYPQDLEQDADLTAVEYLTKTGYSPVAMLTVLEHIVEVARRTGQLAGGTTDQGPSPFQERIAALQTDFAQRHIAIIRRIPEGYLKITFDPAAPVDGQPVTIRVDGAAVLTLGAAVDGQPPLQRAQAIAEQLNAFFNSDPAPYDVHVSTLLGETRLIGGQSELYEVTPADAAYAGAEPSALAEHIRFVLSKAIANAPYNHQFLFVPLRKESRALRLPPITVGLRAGR
jgi:beta-barrel assembly-enhancing protease